ncbi:hypothetical protein J2W27_002960 [Variovorax boronicumulans]|uniref:hypothetical protein n=1 Tax=Variovorax boronicumulans TaxID=436515 RepID=UPI002782397F|nr:hypothetical protein [Variovorax boronicumulans]MDP9910844.1 hypothetical protein [Variovorax boronicumulans]
MTLKPSSRCRTYCLVALLSLATAASAQSSATPSPQLVTLTLDQDLVTFAKWAVSLGGLFLLLFAGTGVLFFGWDVAQTRKGMLEAREDIAKRLEAIRSDHAAFKDLKDRLEQLGAELEAEANKKKPSDALPTPVPKPSTPQPSEDNKDEEFERVRTHQAQIRQQIAHSRFKWMSASTLVERTGLSRNEVHTAVLSDPLLVVSKGTGPDLLVQFRQEQSPNDQVSRYFLGGEQMGTSDAAVYNVLNEHLSRAKEILRKGGPNA